MKDKIFTGSARAVISSLEYYSLANRVMRNHKGDPHKRKFPTNNQCSVTFVTGLNIDFMDSAAYVESILFNQKLAFMGFCDQNE